MLLIYFLHMTDVRSLMFVCLCVCLKGEASGALSEEKLRALKNALNKMEKQLQKVQDQVSALRYTITKRRLLHTFTN